MDKNKKKELMKKYVQDQKNDFEKSLPFNKALFEELFNYLDEVLENYECDDTLKYTTKFLKDKNIPLEKSLNWMNENGGYCDCEVLANIEDKILEL
ncbi:DUF2695 domain-containing protein [Clostridium botulinum]|uniref:DUF2695 domain-containing protein n=1 Tax=Clostridium botulinum TaxID=1491 RepID=UPI0002E7EAE5|nr:DUF2695 domain-containing protein [Clostridium botulinum]KEH97606.1 hypothetical protein Z953_01790 [Clostridium botulinum D str. 16868]KLU76964.1 hypothetical protein CBC3_00960 [Clostridium botulinum V891]KOA79306.1 hypothetical protein ADU78_00090 [Clostridium botulinum]KOA92104.1 hypothetical protein ADU76_09640 [Clostridium botulinum]MCD3204115.1 DUF2695 domain-containing protein [Clostridium botulinum C/D]